MDKEDKEYYERKLVSLKEYFQEINSIKYENTKRVSTLVISIGGAGIYVFFEIMKFVIDEHQISPCWIIIQKSTAFLFLLAILLSFLGLVKSDQAFKMQVKLVRSNIHRLESFIDGLSSTFNQEEEDKNFDNRNTRIRDLNNASIGVLFLAILFQIVIISFAF